MDSGSNVQEDPRIKMSAMVLFRGEAGYPLY